MADVVIVGAGGFGREVIDVCEAMQDAGTLTGQLLGVFDDNPTADNLRLLARRGVRYLGPSAEWPATLEAEFVVGIGSPSTRRAVAHALEQLGRQPATLMHPLATNSSASIRLAYRAGPSRSAQMRSGGGCSTRRTSPSNEGIPLT